MTTTSHKAFTESLPKKRMGAGCLIFDESGRVLLVKPTYKPGWEIPGGVVELDESPRQCCIREVQEEIGLTLNIGRLLVVDYNRQTEERTESLMFIFDGGQLTSQDIQVMRLTGQELSEFRFFTGDNLPMEMTQSLRRRVLAAIKQADNGSGVYLENQEES